MILLFIIVINNYLKMFDIFTNRFKTLEEIYFKNNYDFVSIQQYTYLTDYILNLYNNKNIETNSSDIHKLLSNN